MKKIISILSIILLISVPCFAEWDISKPADDELIPTGPSVIRDNFDALDFALYDYRSQIIQYNSASQLTVTAGGVACTDGSTRKYRGNAASTTVTWADIDTGPEANATYYVYANCDAATETNTFKISLSSTAPSSVTHFRKLGSFVNSGGDITDITNIGHEDLVRDVGGTVAISGAVTMSSSLTMGGNIGLGGNTINNGDLGRTTTGSCTFGSGTTCDVPSGCYVTGGFKQSDGNFIRWDYACP